MQITPFEGPIRVDDRCRYCLKEIMEWDREGLLEVDWNDTPLHGGCLRGELEEIIGEVGEAGLADHLVVIWKGTREYVRLLAYSTELGFSDWALCSVDYDGHEVVVESWSRVEYKG